MRRKKNPKDQEVKTMREAIDDAIESLRDGHSVEAFERLQEVTEPEDDKRGPDED